MLTVILVMVAGVAIGYALRKQRKIVRFTDALTMWAIYLLLFLLGVAIGTNETILKNLPVLGVKALVISLGGVLGSIFLAWLIFIKILKGKQDEK